MYYYQQPRLHPSNQVTWSQWVHDGPHNHALLQALAPLLDGQRSLEDVFGTLLVAGFEVEAIHTALHALDQEGYLHEAAPQDHVLSPNEEAHYAAQMQALAAFSQPYQASSMPPTAAGRTAQTHLKQALVVVAGSGAFGQQLVRALSHVGVGNIIALHAPSSVSTPTLANGLSPYTTYADVVQEDDVPPALRELQPNLMIYFPERFDEQVCQEINTTCIDQKIAFLPCRRRQFEIEIGPLVVPSETACYDCYTRRRAAVMSDKEKLEDGDQAATPHLQLPFGIDWIALETIKILTNVAEPISRGRLWRLNMLSGITEVHSVLKLPRCPTCGIHKQPLRKLWEE